MLDADKGIDYFFTNVEAVTYVDCTDFDLSTLLVNEKCFLGTNQQLHETVDTFVTTEKFSCKTVVQNEINYLVCLISLTLENEGVIKNYLS